jgi:acyl-CoA thioester hydrolase
VKDERRLLHAIEMPVRWGDMDALGHVNNTVYFRYFEQARIQWLETLGNTVAHGCAGPVVVTAACTFKIAIRYPATLHLQMYAGPPGRSSFDTFYEIRDAADRDVLYSTGTARIVWVDHERGCSIALPQSIRALLPVNTVQ